MQQPILSIYQQRAQEAAQQLSRLSRQHNIVTALRLLLIILLCIFGYSYIQTADNLHLALAIAAAVAFLFFLKRSQAISYRKQYQQHLKQINEEEIAFLQLQQMPFHNGSAFAESGHAYALDLDLFGDRSLFQYLNRTATYPGLQRLAAMLLQALPVQAIVPRQEAIAELKNKLDFRQDLKARALFFEDSKERYTKLLHWASLPEKGPGLFLRMVSYILPLALLLSLASYFIFRVELLWDIALRILPLNLLILAIQLKNIRRSLYGTERINELLKQYGSLLQLITDEQWQTPEMRALQGKLNQQSAQAGRQIAQLSAICAELESVQNPFGAVIMNGLFLYHIHSLRKLAIWKKSYAAFVPQWLDVLAEVEAISSLANLAANNPEYVFPEINHKADINFSNLGHPLISASKRVCNDISFQDQRFIVLTGSNMSGKSTFLRTLGVNMVLAGAGSVVCASAARVHPMPVFVSMRQSDSLADSESYFFAEVKRLKFIMEQLPAQKTFVLLDEILRGTNSDDKRSGTLGVIQKLMASQTYGAIATHDLEVCAITDQYPQTLVNMCFEVEIIQNELVFDYKLRKGICHNKSATFLMKKMEIIA
jgi:hypothetical protein